MAGLALCKECPHYKKEKKTKPKMMGARIAT